jgi:hypothetical protein
MVLAEPTMKRSLFGMASLMAMKMLCLEEDFLAEMTL